MISAAFTIVKYFLDRRTKQHQQEFENYHKLIERINRPLENDHGVFLQVQQAAIFELRNYKRYKTVTTELLEQLSGYWGKNPKSKDSICNTINDTLKYLGKTNTPRSKLWGISPGGESGRESGGE